MFTHRQSASQPDKPSRDGRVRRDRRRTFTIEVLDQRQMLSTFAGAVSAGFADPAPAGATVTVQGGHLAYGRPFPGPNAGQSTLDVSTAGFAADQGQTFSLATLTFHNATTRIGTSINAVDLQLILSGAGLGSESITVPLRIDTTSNSEDPTASRDTLSIDPTRVVLDGPDGGEQVLEVLGFGDPSGDVISSFDALEGESTSATLLARFDATPASPSPIPGQSPAPAQSPIAQPVALPASPTPTATPLDPAAEAQPTDDPSTSTGPASAGTDPPAQPSADDPTTAAQNATDPAPEGPPSTEGPAAASWADQANADAQAVFDALGPVGHALEEHPGVVVGAATGVVAGPALLAATTEAVSPLLSGASQYASAIAEEASSFAEIVEEGFGEELGPTLGEVSFDIVRDKVFSLPLVATGIPPIAAEGIVGGLFGLTEASGTDTALTIGVKILPSVALALGTGILSHVLPTYIGQLLGLSEPTHYEVPDGPYAPIGDGSLDPTDAVPGEGWQNFDNLASPPMVDEGQGTVSDDPSDDIDPTDLELEAIQDQLDTVIIPHVVDLGPDQPSPPAVPTAPSAADSLDVFGFDGK